MLTFIAVLLLNNHSFATPGRISANAYQSENDSDENLKKQKSFTAKVRVIREDTEGMEVFFEGEKNKGTFFLKRSAENYAKILKSLETSKKPHGPLVSVTADSERNILSVEIIKDEDKKVDLRKIIDSL